MQTAISDSEWQSLLREALGGRTDFVLRKVDSKAASDSAPMGFMARHLSLIATVGFDGADKRIPFFVKVLPSSEAHRTFLEEMQHFEKEMGMYESAVPAMRAALPAGVELPLPRAFLARRGAEPIIVMEDLREMGYGLWDKMVPCDMPHCLSLLRCLARFHGAALLVQRPALLGAGGTDPALDYAGGVFKMAVDTILRDESGGYEARRWMDSSVRTMASAVAELWPERFSGEGKKKEVEERLREGWRKMSAMAKPSKKHVNAVCHGDLWANNFMFRYEGGEPVDAKLVDLQLVRFAPPAGDVLMFLHLSTTKGFRDEHGRDLLGAYHRFLEETVGKATMDRVMPLAAFLDSIDEYALFGKLSAAIWCSIILGSEEEWNEGEPIDFATIIMRDRGKKVVADARANGAFRQRITESYEECLRQLGLWT